MEKDKKKGNSAKCPNYLAIFALDPKQANKEVRDICKNVLLQILKQQNPKGYLQEEEKHYDNKIIHKLDTKPTQQQISLIEKDYLNFENFHSPKDNYHCTTLFIGNNRDKLNKRERTIFQNWKYGVKQSIDVDFIVYIPGYIMAGFISNTKGIEVQNEMPHMTLLLKGSAKAVESNDVLQELKKIYPEIIKNRNKKINALQISYGTVSRIMYVIDERISLKGITGDNFTCNKK